MSDISNSVPEVPEAFDSADSVSEVYAQVFAINMALQQAISGNERAGDPDVDTDDEYGAAAFGFIGPNLGDITKRLEAAIGAIEENLREVVSGENVVSYTVSFSGGVTPSITLDVTYGPGSKAPEPASHD
jgi:hypothetical protein